MVSSLHLVVQSAATTNVVPRISAPNCLKYSGREGVREWTDHHCNPCLSRFACPSRPDAHLSTSPRSRSRFLRPLRTTRPIQPRSLLRDRRDGQRTRRPPAVRSGDGLRAGDAADCAPDARSVRGLLCRDGGHLSGRCDAVLCLGRRPQLAGHRWNRLHRRPISGSWPGLTTPPPVSAKISKRASGPARAHPQQRSGR